MRLLVIFLIWAPVACVFAADAAAGTGAVSRAGLEDEDLALFFEQRLSQIGALLEAAGDLAGLEPDRAERALAKALEMTIETIGRIRENITSGVIRDRNHWASQSPGTAWDPAGYLTETTGLPSLMARMVKVWLKMNPQDAGEAIPRLLALVEVDRSSEEYQYFIRDLTVMAGLADRRTAGSLTPLLKNREMKVWAFRETAGLLRKEKPLEAARYYGMAFEEALLIGNLETRVLTMSRVALDWSVIDRESGRLAFESALQTVSSMDDPDEVALALGVLGAAWAAIDWEMTYELAASLPANFNQERFFLFYRAAGEASAEEAKRRLLESAFGQAMTLDSPYERERSVGRAAEAMAAVDLERAMLMAAEIGPENHFVLSEFLAEAAREAARTDCREARGLIGRIDDQYIRAGVLISLADGVTACPDEDGPPMLNEAEKILTTRPDDDRLVDLSLAWSVYDPERALKVMDKVTDPELRAVGLGRAAARLKILGDEVRAGQAWTGAINIAEELGTADPMAGIRVLMELACQWAPLDPEWAVKVYELACRKAAG